MQKKIFKNNKGFTLIEVMVVVIIIAILAAIIIPKIMSRPEQAKIVAARQDILAIENALDLYKLDNGNYPTQRQGLSALVKKPTLPPIPRNYQQGGYLAKLPIDPWGHPFHYQNPGQHSAVDIFSYGQSNKPSAHLIGNWNLQRR